MDRLEFTRLREWTDHTTDLGTYVCPHCSTPVRFKTADFERHASLRFTNVSPSWDEAFSRAREVPVNTWEYFLDFVCPGCAAPVRIIYKAGAEFAMGSHGWELLEVLEAFPWGSEK